MQVYPFTLFYKQLNYSDSLYTSVKKDGYLKIYMPPLPLISKGMFVFCKGIKHDARGRFHPSLYVLTLLYRALLLTLSGSNGSSKTWHCTCTSKALSLSNSTGTWAGLGPGYFLLFFSMQTYSKNSPITAFMFLPQVFQQDMEAKIIQQENKQILKCSVKI